MKFKWRKWNRVIHRDFGYFFFGMTLIYAISGIAINHLDDWNPNYYLKISEIKAEDPSLLTNATEEVIRQFLQEKSPRFRYRKHYYPSGSENLKVFIKGGSITINLKDGNGRLELLKRRPVFNQVNFLHYNPNYWWTWFSDIYAVALTLLAITGLFVLKGKNGLVWRGAILGLTGLLIPLIFLLILR